MRRRLFGGTRFGRWWVKGSRELALQPLTLQAHTLVRRRTARLSDRLSTRLDCLPKGVEVLSRSCLELINVSSHLRQVTH
jgi:hypothetical protein